MNGVTIKAKLPNRGGIAGFTLLVAASLVVLSIASVRTANEGPGGVGSTASALATGSSASSPVSPATAKELGRLSLADPVYRLAYDPGRNAIWFATFEVAGPDYLYQVDAVTNAMSRYDLPDTDYNGYLSTIKIARDGAVWLNEPYRMIRFDPLTAKDRALDFAAEDPEAVPLALDPGNPVPGTWISSFAFLGDDVATARNNIPEIRIFDREFKEVGSVTIPRPYAGARDMAVSVKGDLIYALPGLGQTGGVVTLSREGSIESVNGADGTRLETVGSDVFLSGGGGTWLTGGRDSVGPARADSSQESFAVANGDGAVILYDASNGFIDKVIDGQVVSELALQRTEVTIPRPGGDAIVGQAVTQVSDLITDGQGVTWYVDVSANELVRVRLQP